HDRGGRQAVPRAGGCATGRAEGARSRGTRLRAGVPGGSRGAVVPRELAREGMQEPGVVARVAPPETAGLVGEPGGPLQPRILNPRGCLGYEPGVEIKRRADTDQDRRVE